MAKKKSIAYDIAGFRSKRMGNSFIVTADDGCWLQLNEKELENLQKNKIDKELFSKLEEKGIAITDKNRQEIIQRLADKYSFLSNGTLYHIVIPTLRCNMRCIYCHASSKPVNAGEYDMSMETAKKVVDFIFQSPSYFMTIEFQGGEPLLRFDIVKFIVEYARELNKKHKKSLLFNLVTNFSLMDKEKLKFLIDNEVGICTSLDGPELIHNKNRPFGAKGSYESAKEGIIELKEEYKKRGIQGRRANAIITITKNSLPYYKEITDEYVKLGLNDIFLRFLNNLGDARPVWNSISYTPEEFIAFWKKSMDYMLKLNKKGIAVREWFSWIVLQKIIGGIEPNYFEQRSPCGAVIGQLAYNYNGDIYSCDEGRMIGEDIFRLGNVRKNSYKDIITSEQSCALVSSSVNDTQICDSCAYKPFCGICPVCNYAEQGSIIGNISSSARCKIYKAQFDYIFEKLIHDTAAKKIFLSWLEMK